MQPEVCCPMEARRLEVRRLESLVREHLSPTVGPPSPTGGRQEQEPGETPS